MTRLNALKTGVLVLVLAGFGLPAFCGPTSAQKERSRFDAPLHEKIVAQTGDHGSDHDGASDHGSGKKGHGSEGAAEGSGGDGHGGKEDRPPFVWVVFLQVFGFVLLVGVFYWYVWPVLKQSHRERKEQIQSTIQNVEEELENVKEREEETEQRLANLEEEAEQEREEIIQKGKEMKENTIQGAREHAEEILENAEKEAKRERKRARIEIKRELTQNAYKIVQRYFAEEKTKGVHEQFVSGFVERLKKADSIDQFSRTGQNGTATPSPGSNSTGGSEND